MNYTYDFPEKAKYGKIMPKNKIYEHAKPSTRVKNLFISEIERITWAYKLSPETINLPAEGFVKEIQVMLLELRKPGINNDILKTIDKAIPSPILYVLSYNKKIKYAAAYKRQNESDKSKWVISEYFMSGWMKKTADRQLLPVAVNLKKIYEKMIENLILIVRPKNEEIEEYVTRVENIEIKKREADKLSSRINKVKQYNRKVELHSQLKNLKKEIDVLIG